MSRSKEDPSFKEIMDEMGAAANRLADALIDMVKTLMEHQEKQRSEQLKTLMKMLKSAGYEQSPENAQKLQGHLDKIAENKTKLAQVETELAEHQGVENPTDQQVEKFWELGAQKAELLKEQKQLLSAEGGPDLAIDEVALQLKNKNAQGQQAEVAQVPAPAPAPPGNLAPLDDNVLNRSNDVKADHTKQGSLAEDAPGIDQKQGKGTGIKDRLGDKLHGLEKDLKAQAKHLNNKMFESPEKSGDAPAQAVGEAPATAQPKSGLANILNRVNKAGSVGETLAEQARKALKGGIKQVAKLANSAANKLSSGGPKK